MAEKIKSQVDWDAWEKEAMRRSAWGSYVHTMNQIRTDQEEVQYQIAKYKKDTEKVKQIEETREKRSSLLYIG